MQRTRQVMCLLLAGDSTGHKVQLIWSSGHLGSKRESEVLQAKLLLGNKVRMELELNF